jgi:hypothetical protein
MYVVRASSNCTILEWNVGVYGFFSEDWAHFGKNNGLFDVIRAIAFFDLDFQSTWNSTLQARWGPSWFVRSINLNPCLRLRPIIIDAQDDLKTEYMKSQVNSFWTFNAIDIDVLAYTAKVPEENVLHSGVQGKVSVGLLSAQTLENKQLFPYLFRYANPSGDDVRVAYSYYVLFGWRSISLINDESQNGDAKYQVFFELWNANNQSVSSLNLHTVPSSSLPYKTVSINALIKRLRDGTTRLLYMMVEEGFQFTADPHCELLPLNLCFLRDLKAMGVRPPTYQFLADESISIAHDFFSYDVNYPDIRNNMIYDLIHYTRGSAFSDDAVSYKNGVDTLMQQVFRVQPSDYADAYNRYGIYEWSHNTWKSYWEEKVLQGTALTGWAITVRTLTLMYTIGDVLAIILFALNDIMVTHQPTSKSQITTKMIADAISTSRPTFTTFGGPIPFTMPYPGQKTVAPAVVWQRLSIETHYPIAICCSGSYYRSNIFLQNDSVPVWATNTSSLLPPARLRNCTPGQMLSNGLCEWCPAGRASKEFDQTECVNCARGRTSLEKSSECTDCPVGKVANELQMKACTNCIPGSYAASQGLSQCLYCEFGKYSGVSAATGCNECGGDLTTATTASLIPSDCVCPKGTFSRNFIAPNSRNGKVTSCEECMSGLDCESDDWPHSWNAVGNLTSLTKEGYYTLVSSPFDTYKCCAGISCEEECPGGPPGHCEADRTGRTGLVCNDCLEDGHFIGAGTCKRCPMLFKLMILWIVIMTSLMCCLAYYLTNGRLTVDADNPLAMFLFIGLVVTSAQIFGVVKDLDIPWPRSLNGIMSGSGAVFSLDSSGLPLECAVGNWSVALYTVQVLFPYLLLLEILALFAGSKLLAKILKKPSISWEANKTLNVAGQVMQFLFIAFCGIMIKPLQCFRHPNGRWSMKMFPRVICSEGGDHSGLLVLAACICFGFLLPFVAWCVWGCLKAPSESSNANTGFLQRFRFLLYRFRPDCWWWGLGVLLRQTTLAFATVLVVENPHGQLFYTGAALAIYGFLVCRFWPWISGELSFIDAGAMLILVLMMLTASQFLPEPTPQMGRFGILVTLFLIMGALLTRFIFLVVKSVLKNGVFGEFGNGNPNRLTTSKEWLQWLESMKDIPNEDIIETICKMNGFDRESIIKLMSSWSAVTRQGSTGKQKRLTGLPNRVSVSKDRTSQLSRQSSRISSHSLGEASNTLPIHDASENLPKLLTNTGQDSVGTSKSSCVAGHFEKDSEMCTI